MIRRIPYLGLGVLLAMGACSSGPSQRPEAFAMQVADAVARGDWAAYQPLALAHAAALSTDSNPTASRGTFAKLVDAEEGGIHADFDRVVRAGVVRVADLPRYHAVVDSTEPDHWNLFIQDDTGRSTGLWMTLLRFNDTYRVVHLYTRS